MDEISGHLEETTWEKDKQPMDELELVLLTLLDRFILYLNIGFVKLHVMYPVTMKASS